MLGDNIFWELSGNYFIQMLDTLTQIWSFPKLNEYQKYFSQNSFFLRENRSPLKDLYYSLSDTGL